MIVTYYYIEENGVPVPCDDVVAWAAWFESANRHVAVEKIGEAKVSTVFIGIDHSFGDGPPLLYETMVFGGPLDQEMERCSTREQAAEMHKAMCDRVRRGEQ